MTGIKMLSPSIQGSVYREKTVRALSSSTGPPILIQFTSQHNGEIASSEFLSTRKCNRPAKTWLKSPFSRECHRYIKVSDVIEYVR